jgi:hypothetical protein
MVSQIFSGFFFYSVLVNLQSTHVRSFGYLVNVLRVVQALWVLPASAGSPYGPRSSVDFMHYLKLCRNGVMNV